MNWGDLSILALGLGVGGAVGAALAVLAAGSRLTTAWGAFEVAFRTYTHGRTDAETEGLKAAFGSVSESINVLKASVEKLRRALRLK